MSIASILIRALLAMILFPIILVFMLVIHVLMMLNVFEMFFQAHRVTYWDGSTGYVAGYSNLRDGALIIGVFLGSLCAAITCKFISLVLLPCQVREADMAGTRELQSPQVERPDAGSCV